MSFTKDTLGTVESVGGVSLFESLRSNQNASGSSSGLMSAGDKAKLDGIEEGANNYVHPESGVVPGKYMQVEVNEQGHVVAGRTLAEGTLKDYGIVDAYIDLVDNSIVLGSQRLKPLTPSDKVRWDQIVNNPDTLAAYGIKDANISEDGIIRLGEMTIKPLTAESQLNTAKLEGIISKDNLPDTLKDLGLIDVAIVDGTINIGGDLIKPLTAESKLAANKVEGVLDLKNIPVGAMERCVVVNDDTARFALTADDVQKGDTVKVINPMPTMYMVVDESKLNSDEGYVVYSAGNANSVPWSGITDKPDHYYELPPADVNTLGGVIVGDNLTVDATGKISTHAPYVLPKSDTNTLGGVKVGATLDVADDGTLNVPHATAERAGIIKAGDNINIGADGTISGIPYELPVATETTMGGVKIGNNVQALADGTISVPIASEQTAGVVKAGENVTIDTDGTISTPAYELPKATALRLGGVKVGRGLSVDSEGLLVSSAVTVAANTMTLGGVIIGDGIKVDTEGRISVNLPTKVSQLTNDKEYQTKEEVSSSISNHNADKNAHSEAISKAVEAGINSYNTANLKNRLRPGLARNKTYSVGDICFHDSLPSYAYLECITTGVTGKNEPVFDNVNTTITDGTAKFRVITSVRKVNGNYADKNGNINVTDSDKLDGYHESSFLRYRESTETNGADTLWGEIGIKQFVNAIPSGLPSTQYGFGEVVSLATNNNRLDIWCNHQSSYKKLEGGLWFRSGYGNDKKPWVRLVDSLNIEDYKAQLAGASYVVEAKYNADGSWYRKYSDGWLEQGGMLKITSTKTVITLLKPYKNTYYTPFFMSRYGNGGSNIYKYTGYISDVTVTSFKIMTGQDVIIPIGWYACWQST